LVVKHFLLFLSVAVTGFGFSISESFLLVGEVVRFGELAGVCLLVLLAVLTKEGVSSNVLLIVNLSSYFQLFKPSSSFLLQMPYW